jgi:hypothetical protein
VKGTPDGGVHVVRGDPKLAEPLASRSETTTLFGDEVGRVHFVAQNRLGDLHFVPADVKTLVGKLELFLYGSPLRLEDAVSAATTMSALRTAVREALVNEALAADGWSCTATRGPPRLWSMGRRPDEDLSAEDLPEGWSIGLLVPRSHL